jgi:AcrR family transcriptional regulator
VVEAAVRLVDEQGLDALSFRKLAVALDATPMAPYSYVRNKDELLDLMLDLVLGEIDLSGSREGHWVDQLRAMFCSYHRVLLAHPGIAKVYSDRVKIGPNGLRAIERTLSVLRQAGFSPAATVNAFFALFNYTIGFELIGRVNPGGADVASDGNGQEPAKNFRDYFSALPPEAVPTIAALAPRLTGAKTGRRFEYGLDLVLSGLQAKHTARRASS